MWTKEKTFIVFFFFFLDTNRTHSHITRKKVTNTIPTGGGNTHFYSVGKQQNPNFRWLSKESEAI
jgi:hypothetical protein